MQHQQAPVLNLFIKQPGGLFTLNLSLNMDVLKNKKNVSIIILLSTILGITVIIFIHVKVSSPNKDANNSVVKKKVDHSSTVVMEEKRLEQPSIEETKLYTEGNEKEINTQSQIQQTGKAQNQTEFQQQMGKVIDKNEIGPNPVKQEVSQSAVSQVIMPAGFLSYDQLAKNGDNFKKLFSEFSVTNNTLETIVAKSADKATTKQWIMQQAGNAKIILDVRTLNLAQGFLSHKQENGNEIEKAVYKGMSLDAFINRLIQKRPLAFLGNSDFTRLRTKAHQAILPSGNAQWRLVGKPGEREPLVLCEYLSYEEMEIAALLSISVPTFFINKGERTNAGGPGAKGTFIDEGIYVGAVGARFEIPDLMESKYLLIPKGVRPPPILFEGWRTLYDLSKIRPDDTYLLVPKDSTPYHDGHLNHAPYRIRMELSYRPFILHAQAEGERLNQQMILRVVGLGTGVWAINKVEQDRQIFLVVQKLIKENSLPRIDRIEFMWMHVPREVNPAATEGEREGEIEVRDASGKAIKIVYYKGDPAGPKPTGMDNHMVMAMYAWDGNSFPGNEYWLGSLTGSGDPAAVCCSTLQELQNPYINTQLEAPKKLCSY